MREKLEDLKELRDLVRSLGRCALPFVYWWCISVCNEGAARACLLPGQVCTVLLCKRLCGWLAPRRVLPLVACLALLTSPTYRHPLACRGGGWGPLRRAPVQHLDMRGRPGLLRTTLEAQETRGLTRSDDLSRLLPSEVGSAGAWRWALALGCC